MGLNDRNGNSLLGVLMSGNVPLLRRSGGPQGNGIQSLLPGQSEQCVQMSSGIQVSDGRGTEAIDFGGVLMEYDSGESLTKEYFKWETRILPPLFACADFPHYCSLLKFRTFCINVRKQIPNGPRGVTWGKTIANPYATVPEWCPLE